MAHHELFSTLTALSGLGCLMMGILWLKRSLKAKF